MMADFFSVFLQLLFEELPSGMAIGPQACDMTQVILNGWTLMVILEGSMVLVMSQVYSHQRLCQ